MGNKIISRSQATHFGERMASAVHRIAALVNELAEHLGRGHQIFEFVTSFYADDVDVMRGWPRGSTCGRAD